MKEADFGGYATKANLKCTDGRTIMPDAFKHMDGQTVPLVWQHGHSDPTNVLGHGVLEARMDGMYVHGFFNDTPQGQTTRDLVRHEDINKLSIYANRLVERAKSVYHGVIREVSLVLSGANPGAVIDYVAIQHSDGETEILEDEAVIYTGLTIEHSDGDYQNESVSHEDDEKSGGKTVKDVYDGLSEEEKNVVHYMIGAALEASGSGEAKQSDDDEGISHEEGSQDMNVFEQNGGGGGASQHVLTHDAVRGIVEQGVKTGSLKAAVEDYALEHGINDIELLFPDYRTQDATPEWIKRRTEWVAGVLNGVRSNPFTRLKTRHADITHDEARAKGYITGNMKKEEFFGVAQRVTSPQTIYKKQQLDRDDILDITDFDVVAWMKAEMRVMLEEELARAILVGDGREVDDEDKVRDPSGAPEGSGIRSILHDHELYAHTIEVTLPEPPEEDPTAPVDYEPLVEAVARSRRFYKGSGTPNLYTTEATKVEMLLSKDHFGRRRYNTDAELASALRVGAVISCEAIEDLTPENDGDLLGIIVNLKDYSVGADKGGETTFFDDFDIDFNKYKYLLETRLSGALTKVKSALILKVADDV